MNIDVQIEDHCLDRKIEEETNSLLEIKRKSDNNKMEIEEKVRERAKSELMNDEKRIMMENLRNDVLIFSKNLQVNLLIHFS